MRLTYGDLFRFMSTFSNQGLADAQVIAEHHHKSTGCSYNQALIDVLVQMLEQEQELEQDILDRNC